MYLLAPGLATTHLQGAWIGRRCEAEHLLREKRTGTKLGSRAEADNHVAPQCVRTVPADPLTRPSFPDLRIFPPSCLSQLSDVVRRPVFYCLFNKAPTASCSAAAFSDSHTSRVLSPSGSSQPGDEAHGASNRPIQVFPTSPCADWPPPSTHAPRYIRECPTLHPPSRT